MIIGLTGPIASGKNVVAGILKKEYGAAVIDVDEVGHELLNKLKKKIIEEFGERILSPRSGIDRNKLGKIVFSDRSKLRALEKIIHPAMVKEVKKHIGNLKRRKNKLIVINAAVLCRMGLQKIAGEVWAVLANENLRLKRLVRQGLSKKEALDRIHLQDPEEEYLKYADRVILNEGSIGQIRTGFQL